MIQRVITAAVALAVLLTVVILAPPAVTEILIAIVLLGAAWEWSVFVARDNLPLRIVFVALLALVLALVARVITDADNQILLAGLGFWAAAFIWLFFYPTTIPKAVKWLAGVIILVPTQVALLNLYELGPRQLLFALLIVWVADSGAFVAGKTLGRVKLAPSISPGKTWEGVIGGLLAVGILATLLAGQFGVALSIFLPFCLAVAILSIVGDLTVSMFKRDIGIKDSGTLFPGHGGILDRIDSIAAATPLFALGLTWIGTS